MVFYQQCYKYLIFQWHLNILASNFPAFRNFHHPPFSLQKISRPPKKIICPPFGIHNECSLNKWPGLLCIRHQPSWVCVQSSEAVTVGSTIAGSVTNNTLTTEISSLHWSTPCITVWLLELGPPRQSWPIGWPENNNTFQGSELSIIITTKRNRQHGSKSTNYNLKTWPFEPAEESLCFLRGPLECWQRQKNVNASDILTWEVAYNYNAWQW